MLKITKEPAEYAAGGRETEHRIEMDTAKTLDVKIVDAQTAEVLGTKRYTAAATVAVDAAPIVRRHIRFAPERGWTGFAAAKDRMKTVKVRAETDTETATSGRSVYHAGDGTAEAPALLTTLPRQRLIGPAEQDEITLLTTAAPWMTVRATGPDGTEEHAYTAENSTLHLFRLNAADFPDAEHIELVSGDGQRVEYTVAAPPSGARRIAWRTHAGSLEHYTFPLELAATVTTKKKRIYAPSGSETMTTAKERRLRLRSAYETREMLEALAEILVAPQVWLADEDGYTPVTVLTDEATVHRHGTMGLLEIEIGL